MGFMFCPNCGMLKSNCICGYFNKKDKNKNHKIDKEVKVDSPQKVSIPNKKYSNRLNSNKEKIIPKIIPPQSSKFQEKILSEILDSIKEGYKFIVLEANHKNSDTVVQLANNFESSIILTANEKSQMRYNRKYQLRKNFNIHLTNQIKFLDDFENIEKSNILIIDDAHRLDENIINLFSYTIDLSNYNKLINNFKCKVKDLPEKDYTLWIDFINYLSLDDEKIKRVVKCIKENPKNWICSYDDSYYYYNRLSFYPLNIGNLANEYYFSKSKTCILISSSILDFELFATELGLDSSQIKFIHYNLPVNSDKNKIYARKTVNMQNNNLSLLIPLIKNILERHNTEKGLILTNHRRYSEEIMGEIKSQRLLTYSDSKYYKQFKKFSESFNSVMVTDFLEDGIEFPYNQCKFQIIVKQHSYPNNERSKYKEKRCNWYSYKQIINLMEPLQRPITSEHDYCTTYILDEGILKSITKDIIHNNFIPNYIIDLIVDLDMENSRFVSDNIKKQFGVYYLFDYDKYKRHENKKIWAYKDYNKEIPNIHKEEFNYFTTKLMEAISELSNLIIDVKFNKLALVSVPSSTVERDNLATVKESINIIEKWYNEGKARSEFNCKKEIINCGNLLKRVIDVDTSHKNKRVSYIQHINSIAHEKNNILNEDDVAFIILDDVSTRGTIMNVCEDILINNGVKKENIYKFALFKTVW